MMDRSKVVFLGVIGRLCSVIVALPGYLDFLSLTVPLCFDKVRFCYNFSVNLFC